MCSSSDFCSWNWLEVGYVSGIHQISIVCRIWPYKLSLLIICILVLSTFSSPCSRACYRRNSPVELNSICWELWAYSSKSWINRPLVFCTFLSFECQIRSMFIKYFFLLITMVLLRAINLFYKKLERQKYKIIQCY